MTDMVRHICTAGRSCVAGALAFMLCAGCTSVDGRWTADRRITATLYAQAEAWNAGDIDAFMEPYWQSPELTFSSGGRVTRGWEETLAGYRKRYPSREAMGHLTFSDLQITRISNDAALVLGRWRLDRAAPIGGAFSLVWRRDGDRWVIIHDHTSSETP